MDIWALIVGLAVIIGIAAGIVQVLQYVQERREKKRQPTAEEVVTSSPPALAVPSNLPPRSEFIGREKEKARVMEALASRWPLTCIDGIGGIGKTALALEVAGECLQASKGEVPADGTPTFDGFIWTTAKDRELALNDVLDAIARTLDYPGIAQQPLEEKRESVRKLLQTKPYLLIVDNFETVTDDAVRDFLLRLPEPTKVLITSREQKLRQGRCRSRGWSRMRHWL
ncbi:MAG: ATP-binding protein [Chloroflexi bacterium]|nr:ATP-binding protein [Chloroflexota bacterium]